MKRLFTLTILMVFPFISFSQQGDGGLPHIVKSADLSEIPVYVFSQPDINTLRAEDKINDSLKTGPWRFGYNYESNLNLNNAGKWYDLPNGAKVWMLRINGTNAKTINLTFSNTKIPEGNELFIYNPEQTFVLGKFTQNHIYQGELGAELIPGAESYVQYYVAPYNVNGSVNISTVTYGYRTATEFYQRAFGSSGGCNMNVNCPDGTPYTNQRNSAVMLVSGSNGFCSGALINNTSFDGTPYVLTANHCATGSVTNWIFRFNWQATNCSNPASSPSFLSLSGAVLRAKRQPSDFALVEITGGLNSGQIPENYNPYFAGWNRQNEPAVKTFCISHPSGDIKKIAFDDDPPVAVQAMGSSEANSSWEVTWDRNTVTEGGSSGSPLFNEKGQIIGQLWGGGSSCSNAGTPDAYDYYGRIHNSWEPAGSSINEQLKHWLDPTNNGAQEIDGYDPYGTSVDHDAFVYSLVGFKENMCNTSFVPKFTLMNKGDQPLTSLTIEYDYGTQGGGTINWTGNLAKFETETIQLPLYTNINGNNSISVVTSNPNGQPDDNPDDNSISIDFVASPNGNGVDFEFNMSCWPEENSWDIKDGNNNIILSGGNYTTEILNEQFCLDDGCYTLTLYDTYGDGVAGEQYWMCGVDGYMTLTEVATNSILAELLKQDADFGSEISYNFCINTLSLNAENLEYKFNIYPNPSDGNFKIETNVEGEKQILIIDVTGQIVHKKVTNSTDIQIQKSLSSGVYLVNILHNDNKVTKRLVVK